jgi:hypothetical protein
LVPDIAVLVSFVVIDHKPSGFVRAHLARLGHKQKRSPWIEPPTILGQLRSDLQVNMSDLEETPLLICAMINPTGV